MESRFFKFLFFISLLFVLIFSISNATTADAQQMYVTNSLISTVSQANLDGSSGVSIGNPGGFLSAPSSVALDTAAGKMYVVNNVAGTVTRANLDGSGAENLGNPGSFLSGPRGIALDTAAGKMYVTSAGNNRVVRANLDGSGAENLGNPGGFLSLPTGIALDVSAGKMYVVNQNNAVTRANLDGTGGENLGNLNNTLVGARGIALDVSAGKMYVTNANNNTVSQANLDGTGGVSIGNFGGTLSGPRDIALDLSAGKMYVANFSNSTVSQANLDGTGGVSIGNFGGTLNRPWGIALNIQEEEFKDFMSCNFTCIPSGNDGFKEITVLEVVNQNEHRREGCVDVVLWNGSGHSPIGFKVKLTHYDLDKVNICKMLYDAKRAGLINEIPRAGALQVRLDSFWLIDLIQNFDLRNFGVNAWTTNYVSSSTFPFRDTDPNLSKMISSNKSNCVMVTTPPEGYSEAPYAYPLPDHWVHPIFIQDTGGPGDEACNYDNQNPD